MTATATEYRAAMGGGYATTVAALDDGRVVTVDTQYARVYAHGQHAGNCDQINKMGGRCTCGLMDGIDEAALVADARVRGVFGQPQVAVAVAAAAVAPARGLCPKCGTYCCGDCEA
jgi:hypothetical protein